MKPLEKSNKWKAALHYQSLGLSIIPVGKNKKPLLATWTEYQTNTPSPETIDQWWGKDQNPNIAMVTGKNGKYITLDVDVKNGVNGNESLKQMGVLPPTACYRTGSGGMQYIFNHPSFRVPTRAGIREGLDVRGDGGYAILPPSENESGSYEWVVPIEDGVSDAPDWLLDEIKNNSNSQINKSAILTEIVNGVPEGNRNDAACSLIGTLLHRFPKKDWGLVWVLTQSWNNSNKPPISDAELMTKFEALARKEASKPETVSTENVSQFREAMSLKELCELNIPPVEWDIERLIEHGTPNMISAAPNNYKSWVIIHEAICMASGTKVFGHFKTKQQAVMIVNEEDHKGQLKKRIQMLLGKDNADLPIYLHIQEELKLTKKNVDNLLAEAKRKSVTCIMFDSLRAIHNADENDSSQMQVVMDFFMHFIREGITVIFTHHHRKKSRDNFSKRDTSGEDSRGSTSINAAVHGHLTCEPKMIDGKEKLVIYQPKLKCDQKLEPFQVDIVLDEGGNTMKFVYDGEYSADDSLRGQVKGSIVAILDGNSTWLSKKDFGKAIKAGSESTIRKALLELEAEKGVVSKTKVELANFGVTVSSDGSHNEKFYQLPKNDLF